MNSFADMTTDAATGWFQIALFAAIVYVRTAKPKMIRSLTLYRWACTALVFSILAPVALNLFLVFFIGPNVARSNPYGMSELTPYNILCSATGSIALSAGLFCFFAALAPPVSHEIRTKPTAPTPLQKHPLD